VRNLKFIGSRPCSPSVKRHSDQSRESSSSHCPFSENGKGSSGGLERCVRWDLFFDLSFDYISLIDFCIKMLMIFMIHLVNFSFEVKLDE